MTARIRWLALVLLALALAVPTTARAAGGDILVTDELAEAVFRVNPATAGQTAVSTFPSGMGPRGVALEANGEILVALTSGSSDTVARVNPTAGAQTTVSSAGSLQNIYGIAVAANGDIFVSDDTANAIVRVNPSSGAQSTVSSGGSLDEPRLIALGLSGEILVADAGANAVIRVNPSTGAQTTVSSGGTFDNPWGVVAAANGDILVADVKAFGGSGGVIRVNPTTGLQTPVSVGGNFTDPNGIALAANGDLLVADEGSEKIVRVDPMTGVQTVVSSGGSFHHLFGITLAPDAAETTIDSGPSGSTSDATPTFTFSSSQSGSSFECRVDGGVWASCTSPYTTATLSDGTHTLEARAVNGAGTPDATPESRSFTVDTAAPQTTIDSGPAGLTSDSTPTVGFSSDEPVVTFECSVDGAAFAPCASPVLLPPLSDGSHSLEVRAVDPAGNVDPTAASRSFTVDTGDPETTIDSGPGALANDSTPTFGFSSDEPGATFQCSLDGDAFSPCASPFTLPPLPDGSHTLEVRSVDGSGNLDPTPEIHTFTVDTTAPDTTITSGPSGETDDTTPTFSFSSDQTGATFACRIDGSAWTPCSSSHTTAPLSEGDHTFEVRSIDAAGNAEPAPESRTFRVRGASAQPSQPASGQPASPPTATLPPSGSAPPSGAPLVLSDVSISPRRFRLGRKRCATVNKKASRTTPGKKRKRNRTGCSFAYRVSRGATVTFTIEADSKGRRTGKKCARQTRNNTKLRRCVRRKRLGRFAQRSTAGKNATRFRPKLGRKRLKPGFYRVTLVARDSAGSVSRAVRLEFRIVARKKQFEVLARGKRPSARRGA